MDFAYTPEQDELRALARRVLADRATPQRVAEVEATEERIDRDLWRALAGAGLLGVAVPEAYGGGGLSIVELCALLEEVGRAVAPVPAYATLLLGALPVAAFGDEATRQRLLPGVVSGEVLLSGGLDEPRNPEPLAPSTRAVARNGGWQLDGVKLGVPAAAAAAAVVVSAALDGGAETGLFLVDPHDPGVTLERQVATNREVQYLVTLDGAAGQRLGDGDALAWLIRRATVGLCAMQVGVTDRALRMTAEYTSSREQFGRPLSAFQAVSQRAADAYVDVQGIRLTAQAATWRLAEGEEAGADAAIAVAKFWAAEAAQRVVHAAQHLHGGVGVDVSYPLHRSFLWAKQLELGLGGGTHQLLRLGAMIAAS
ncbi:MAG TPA: acyl-CoA dehydrogenase family protein [Candidatus Dormibacteraeota bacterium]|nr:acyl-CoA dehydrogenase family protein [Candidatus Dormibacteraeota bacterium]